MNRIFATMHLRQKWLPSRLLRTGLGQRALVRLGDDIMIISTLILLTVGLTFRLLSIGPMKE